jgi:hypothetical protein
VWPGSNLNFTAVRQSKFGVYVKTRDALDQEETPHSSDFVPTLRQTDYCITRSGFLGMIHSDRSASAASVMKGTVPCAVAESQATRTECTHWLDAQHASPLDIRAKMDIKYSTRAFRRGPLDWGWTYLTFTCEAALGGMPSESSSQLLTGLTYDLWWRVHSRTIPSYGRNP